MRKKGNRKSIVADLLKTPSPTASPPEQSPAIFSREASTSKSNKRVTTVLSKSLPQKALSNISDLKDLASSRIDELKRQIDCSHSEILKDLEASQSRLHKRFKMQTQACQQVMDEADKDHRKVSERISESREAMKGSYEEFVADVQASASRACKNSITELSQSFEKSINSLRNRYGISSS